MVSYCPLLISTKVPAGETPGQVLVNRLLVNTHKDVILIQSAKATSLWPQKFQFRITFIF